MPFDQIAAAHVAALIERRVREDRTLEFKEQFEFGEADRFEFLRDVTAMANASGGTIIYGVVEGDRDDRGIAIGLRALRFAADEREKQVANVLRDGVEERIPGVMHRAIDCDGGYLYVVRIPASRLAPHMITLKSQRPRFYMRATTANDPMNVHQIKEAVLRSQGAEERALALIEARTVHYLKRYADVMITNPGGATVVRPAAQVLLHVVPLFAPEGGLDLAQEDILKRFEAVPPFYCNQATDSHGMSLDGYMNYEWIGHQTQADRSVTLLRRGALEFHVLNVAADTPTGVILDVVDLENSVLEALRQAAALAEAGLVLPPALVSLRLLRMGSAILFSERLRLGRRSLPDGNALLDPLPVHDWSELDVIARRLFDVLWQAFGFRRSSHYNDRGTRII